MLNIKNPKAHQLAAEVSARTGESLTDTVIHALEEKLERLPQPVRRRASREELLALLETIRKAAPPEFFADEDPTAFLYDPETGLPA